MDDRSEQSSGAWLYAGIDEAGYGPVLGPLCVASSVFAVREPIESGGAAPDLWKVLKRAVSRAPSRTARGKRLAIADSKALKLPNPKEGATTQRDPLMHLERGVLAMLHAQGQPVAAVEDLLVAVGAQRSGLPWYAAVEGGDALPRSTTAAHIRMHGAHLAGVMESAGVQLCALRCQCVDEVQFNEQLGAAGVKSEVSFGAVALLLREVWSQTGSVDAEACPRVVIDRQGGRRCYQEALEEALPGAQVEALCETAARSAYVVTERRGGATRSMRVFFEVEAERKHLPVALASMVAKLVRELMMARFNAHFGARSIELKPTAGYHSDGMRWLRDAEPILTAQERATLRRLA
ncbi:MAG: hypothetical protein KDA20_05865 [Phycisphaerales bacterium]|nr:hypothetical protein [Phycisphaerales bacterium]